MTEPEYKPPYGLIYFGLSAAIVVQLLVIVMALTGDLGAVVPPAGNVVAAIVCAGAIWLIRQRQKGRL